MMLMRDKKTVFLLFILFTQTDVVYKHGTYQEKWANNIVCASIEIERKSHHWIQFIFQPQRNANTAPHREILIQFNKNHCFSFSSSQNFHHRLRNKNLWMIEQNDTMCSCSYTIFDEAKIIELSFVWCSFLFNSSYNKFSRILDISNEV